MDPIEEKDGQIAQLKQAVADGENRRRRMESCFNTFMSEVTDAVRGVAKDLNSLAKTNTDREAHKPMQDALKAVTERSAHLSSLGLSMATDHTGEVPPPGVSPSAQSALAPPVITPEEVQVTRSGVTVAEPAQQVASP